MIGRLMMTLTGFILAMLGVITFIHSDYNILGILILFSGVVSMFAGLPDNTWHINKINGIKSHNKRSENENKL